MRTDRKGRMTGLGKGRNRLGRDQASVQRIEQALEKYLAGKGIGAIFKREGASLEVIHKLRGSIGKFEGTWDIVPSGAPEEDGFHIKVYTCDFPESVRRPQTLHSQPRPDGKSYSAYLGIADSQVPRSARSHRLVFNLIYGSSFETKIAKEIESIIQRAAMKRTG